VVGELVISNIDRIELVAKPDLYLDFSPFILVANTFSLSRPVQNTTWFSIAIWFDLSIKFNPYCRPDTVLVLWQFVTKSLNFGDMALKNISGWPAPYFLAGYLVSDTGELNRMGLSLNRSREE
jgi:hypothetical protein